ncbi:coiled-coil domain-containing protein 160 [Psammomys obesus]|uniref:coiled-coil domain-containing protein 160 n=1 Tax=Psammomys obesus TaxID=48139 RepID=UPI002452BB01|nr:coiled-coil domain-containing protein 160 [Psammomys obesus]
MNRTRPRKNNTLVHFLNEDDYLEEPAPLQSFSEQTTDKRMDRTSGFSSRIAEEGTTFKRKDSSFQIAEREQDPTLRDGWRKSPKNVPNTNSAFCDLIDFDRDSPQRESPSDWSKKELSTASQRNRKKWSEATPKLRLYLLNEELRKLNQKCCEIEQDFENAEKELLNCRREAMTRAVNFQEPGTAASKNDRELQALKNDLSEKTKNVKNITEELQQAKEVMCRLNLENRKLKYAIRKLKHQTEISTALLREEMKLYFELEMEKIRLDLDALKHELRTEKSQRVKNTRALEMLGRHFASVMMMPTTADHITGNTF